MAQSDPVFHGSITVWNVSGVTRWFPHLTEFPRVK